jgi:hypothetical protein
MNDKITLLGTALYTVFFFVTGIMDLLDHFMVQAILFTGFMAIVVDIILVKTKGGDKKDLPE